jgi:hypothetical protein
MQESNTLNPLTKSQQTMEASNSHAPKSIRLSLSMQTFLLGYLCWIWKQTPIPRAHFFGYNNKPPLLFLKPIQNWKSKSPSLGNDRKSNNSCCMPRPIITPSRLLNLQGFGSNNIIINYKLDIDLDVININDVVIEGCSWDHHHHL